MSLHPTRDQPEKEREGEGTRERVDTGGGEGQACVKTPLQLYYLKGVIYPKFYIMEDTE